MGCFYIIFHGINKLPAGMLEWYMEEKIVWSGSGKEMPYNQIRFLSNEGQTISVFNNHINFCFRQGILKAPI